MKKIQEKKTIQITVKVDIKKVHKIDAWGEKMKLNRAQMVRNLLDSGLDDLELMNTGHILTMALKGYDLLGSIKNSLSKKNFIVDDNNKLVIDL